MSKSRVLSSFLKAKYRRFVNREHLERWQMKKVQQMLANVIPYSPFYSELIKDKEYKDWRSFPIINKQVMMDNFSFINTVGIPKEKAFEFAIDSEKNRNFIARFKDITIGLSSGTSGNRGIFLLNQNEIDAWTGYILAKMIPNIFRKHRIAFFLRANSNLYQNSKTATIDFVYFDLTKPMNYLVDRLVAFKPTVIVGPPSVLSLMVELDLPLRPQRVISVADVLEPQEGNKIQNFFAQQIHQIYQATEGCIGLTCREGDLHLNEDILVVQKEYLDEHRFVPIITDFSRRTQPIIRYRLDDILVEDKNQCKCGSIFTRISRIEGRCDDILRIQGKVVFPDFIRRAIIMVSPMIQDYNVVFDGHYLNIGLKTHEDVFKMVSTSLSDTFKELGVELPEIQYVKYNPPDLLNKRIRVSNRKS